MRLISFYRRAGLFVLISALCFSEGFCGEDPANWPNWRGPRDEGSTTQGTYPVKWDATNVLWKAPLPGKGCSTPVVWDKRIFVTAPIDGQDGALGFDWNGKALWQRTFGAEKAGKRQNSSGCNPSPTTDGQSVFVYFKSGTLAALDFDGKTRWQTNLVTGFGPESLFWDQGTSPVLTRDAVVVARMHHGDSWLAAFDKASGQLRWKVARNYETAVEGDNSYTTPLVIGPPGKQVILVWGGEHLTAHSAVDGQLVWSCADFNPRGMSYWPTVASPIVSENVVVVAYGRADRDQPRLHGIKLGGTGDVTATHRAWLREDFGTFVPTPVVYEGKVYVLRDHGEVECLDPATGKTVWRDDFPRTKTSYYASPVIAAGKLYAAREDGVIFVAQITGKFQVLAENKMGEQVIGSPVAVANRLLIRGERNLFCIE
ncbi:MAG TPA: PQQ-binding-like beta-propeller repeat protein [Verrucomicrobiae bacterium]